MKKINKKITVDELAGMVQRGLQDTTKTILAEMKRGFAEVNKNFAEVNNNIRILAENNANEHNELKLERTEVAYKFEVSAIGKRVEVLEKKAGVKVGKESE